MVCGDTALKGWDGIDDSDGQETIFDFIDAEEVKTAGHGMFLEKGVLLERDSGGAKDFSCGGALYMEEFDNEPVVDMWIVVLECQGLVPLDVAIQRLDGIGCLEPSRDPRTWKSFLSKFSNDWKHMTFTMVILRELVIGKAVMGWAKCVEAVVVVARLL